MSGNVVDIFSQFMKEVLLTLWVLCLPEKVVKTKAKDGGRHGGEGAEMRS